MDLSTYRHIASAVLTFCGALVLCALAAPVQAQDAVVADRLEAAFVGWMEENGVSEGSIAIRYKGAPVRVASKGREDAAPIALASIGKAITALCTADLVSEGLLDWADDVNALLGRGPEGLSVAALVTHRSGIGPDSTQNIMGMWLNEDEHRAAEVLDAVDGRELASEPGSYAYNNENYALLGLVIEKASGAAYREECARRVLAPAGVATPPVAIAEGFLPWGGWSMPADDFAALYWHWFGRDDDPFASPHTDMRGGAFYGLGTVFREFRDSYNYWHFGALCFPLRFNAGSYAVIWEQEWSAVVGYSGCLDWDQMGALDGVLAGAVFGR